MIAGFDRIASRITFRAARLAIERNSLETICGSGDVAPQTSLVGERRRCRHERSRGSKGCCDDGQTFIGTKRRTGCTLRAKSEQHTVASGEQRRRVRAVDEFEYDWCAV